MPKCTISALAPGQAKCEKSTKNKHETRKQDMPPRHHGLQLRQVRSHGQKQLAPRNCTDREKTTQTRIPSPTSKVAAPSWSTSTASTAQTEGCPSKSGQTFLSTKTTVSRLSWRSGKICKVKLVPF